MRITNSIICTKDELLSGHDLVVQDGRISSVEKTGKARGDAIDARGMYVLPGFTEIHTHGAALFEFTAGRYDPHTGSFETGPDIYREELPRYAARMASTGVTSLYLGTWAAPIPQLKFCLAQLKDYLDTPANGRDGALIRGAFLEGTFFNPDMCGAQNPGFILRPDIKHFEDLNETGVIKMANVVPDFGQASCSLISQLTAKGVSVGAGHTDATADQFTAAADSGLKYCVHFLNGPTGTSYKTFDRGGAVEGILQEDRIYVELIMDGFHVNPAYIRDTIHRKGPYRVIAVTDAIFASQATGIKEFVMNGIHGRMSDDGSYAYVTGKKKLTLFSSLLTMDAALENLLCLLTRDQDGIWHRTHKAIGFRDALPLAVRMCSTNAHEMLRMYDCEDTHSGSIAEGKWADIIMADIRGEPGNYCVRVDSVFVRGRKVP